MIMEPKNIIGNSGVVYYRLRNLPKTLTIFMLTWDFFNMYQSVGINLDLSIEAAI